MTAVEAPSYNWNQAMSTTDGLSAGPVHIVGLGNDETLVHGVHIRWDAVFAATITIWSSNFPLIDAPLNADPSPGGAWVQQNPPTGYTAISPTGSATAAPPLVLVIPGGTAGGADLSWGNAPQKRFIARVNVTAGGTIWMRTHGKF